MRPLRSFLLLLLLLAIFAGFDYFFPGTGIFPSPGDFLPPPRNTAPLVPASSKPAEQPFQRIVVGTAVRRTTLIDSLIKAGGQVRIMYYGDSQIEGDRITARLREELTGLYGGSGPGLFLPLMPMMYTQSYWLKSSPNWKRYNFLSYRKGEIPHNDLGPFMALCRYLPPGTASPGQTLLASLWPRYRSGNSAGGWTRPPPASGPGAQRHRGFPGG